MEYELGCNLNYTVDGPSTLVFHIEVARSAGVTVPEEELVFEPTLPYERFESSAGGNRFLRVNAVAGPLRVHYRARVSLDYRCYDPALVCQTPPSALPMHVLPYLYPSRYCQSDRLVRLARDEFGAIEPGYSRVTAICNYIYQHFAYLPGSSGEHTSAFDTITERAGVCRDFAHVGIALCRALEIPARFVSGYAYSLNPPDFHACFEAYLGGQWCFFDPTRLAPQHGYIRIGTGRDAAEVAFCNLFGNVNMTEMELFVNALPGADGNLTLPDYTDQAIVIP